MSKQFYFIKMPNKVYSNKLLKIGDVFTPLKWANFAIEKYDIYTQWIDGASVFDPTMGNGNLLSSLIEYGISKGKLISELPTEKLFGNELNKEYYREAIAFFKAKYQIDLSSNFTNEDFLLLPETKYDIVFGNPPWGNFNNLPQEYKPFIKGVFEQYDLITSKKSLLLGCSRMDIAALIIAKVMKDFLVSKGNAYFFAPLSLLLNEGAHNSFRKFKIHNIEYALKSVYDFCEEKIFENVSTRYGLIHLKRNEISKYPVLYYKLEAQNWEKYYAKPIFNKDEPLSVFKTNEGEAFKNIKKIQLPQESIPRQGINTCGANYIYFFDKCDKIDNELVSVSNDKQFNIILPSKFLYPLITSNQFINDDLIPNKWVLLPYDVDGSLLEVNQLQSHPELYYYFLQHEFILKNRKGVMIQSIIKRGRWWSLLGVGFYNFYPYKLVWEAYGRKTLRPKIFTTQWQANQSLQAYIPFTQYDDANAVCKYLSENIIEQFLLSHQMGGTMNWAQPGKIKKLFQFY